MALVMALVLAAPLRAELRDCEGVVETTFQHLLALEWNDAPEGVSVVIACGADQVLVLFSGPAPAREEPVSLSGLSPAARARLLAVIVGERGRAWLEGALEPVRRPLVLVAPPAEPTPPPAVTRAEEVRPALWTLGTSRLHPWRVGLGAAGSVGQLGPLRAGGTVRSALGLGSLAATVVTTSFESFAGLATLTQGTLSAGLSLVCLQGAAWQACARARLVGGYGVVQATPGFGFVATKVEAWLFGGEGELSFLVAPLSVLFVELALSGGWTSGVVATIDGRPLASMGGWNAALSVTVGTSWR